MVQRSFDASSQHRLSAGIFLLYLGADCEQACLFCALKSYQPPVDGGDVELAELLRRAGEARGAGIDHVQFEGIDPPRFSRILALTEGVTALGFSHLTVTGTARRFADSAFVEEFFARAPPSTVVVAPLYGVTPAVHDAVTRQVGSFVEVRAAIENLKAVRGGGCLALTTVPTPVNVGELAQVLEFGASMGVSVRGRLPYPLRRAGIEAYQSAAIRETDLIQSFAESLPNVARRYRTRVAKTFTDMLQHPCALYRVADRRGNSTLRPSGSDQWRLEGADGPSKAVDTVPCPHVASCDLATRCPGLHYEAYAERFGLAEFFPVPPTGVLRRLFRPITAR